VADDMTVRVAIERSSRGFGGSVADDVAVRPYIDR
jgi:hypothetical protein